MPRHYLALLLALFGHFFVIHAQERYTLSGTISEASSNETLIGVTVAIPSYEQGPRPTNTAFIPLPCPKVSTKLL